LQEVSVPEIMAHRINTLRITFGARMAEIYFFRIMVVFYLVTSEEIS
jgi:hypothetical protein